MVEDQDRLLICVDCGADFIWSVGEQTFFASKGLKNEPKRCKPCKTKKNKRLATVAQSRAIRYPSGRPFERPSERPSERIDVRVNCAQCGVQTTVPFQPTQGRPVYCRDCFLEIRGMAPSGAASGIS